MSAVEYENMNFLHFGRFQHTHTWQKYGDVHLCVCVCEAAGLGLYASGRARRGWGVRHVHWVA